MPALLRSFASDQLGATAIEYCLIASLVAMAIITAPTSVGTNLAVKYNSVALGFR